MKKLFLLLLVFALLTILLVAALPVSASPMGSGPAGGPPGWSHENLVALEAEDFSTVLIILTHIHPYSTGENRCRIRDSICFPSRASSSGNSTREKKPALMVSSVSVSRVPAHSSTRNCMVTN